MTLAGGQGRSPCRAPPMRRACPGDAVGQEDRRGNLFPTKVRENRIDAAVALLMAVGRAQASEADLQPDITAFFTDPLFA